MISALANHLWQSTLFACVVGLATLALRRNSASVRHGLWVAASLKFLIPFSLLVGLGSRMEWRNVPVALQPRLNVVEQIGEPLGALASPARLLPRRTPSRIPAALARLMAFRICGQLSGVVAALAASACRLTRGIACADDSSYSRALQPGAPGAWRVRGIPALPPAAGGSERTADSGAVFGDRRA